MEFHIRMAVFSLDKSAFIAHTPSMDLFDPIPSRASKANISAFAEQVSVGIGLTRGAMLEPVVARMGGKIVYKTPQRMDGKLPESIVVRSGNDFTIFLPSITSLVRDRFTIAHELGHLFIHYPMVAKQYPGAAMRATRWVDPSNADLQRTEWEANWFAASFLMREKDFRAAYAQTSDIKQLASMFVVSEQSASIRAESLGLQ
ncbi:MULTISPECIES: ImmA/IrrE family metallo-endopeptidase [Methylosinus]|uniref:ImmA/IrrE family metallo-endopeptidase n=1 Tax=Methylosinus trichosporium (strain ATCC 35070 / NCIMB 11131 / UNIQEM 75 / OB3b) TaxID=595536 RepID=A0A2D2D2S6_METT3|nr:MULTISPECIES: ImmA/IrrE family metallo-endopeptidase [Methylosinus]ATQ69300.1 ImmA/IrrE family metallo-endopeptidase [Methylosinus trichosporium OB3b]OBS50435.1 hypothetical protein A8B73_21625 [Methylosinus sp. 3S-1]